jgi:hypothetical protein
MDAKQNPAASRGSTPHERQPPAWLAELTERNTPEAAEPTWRGPEHDAKVAAGRQHERERGPELDAFARAHFATRRVTRRELRAQRTQRLRARECGQRVRSPRRRARQRRGARRVARARAPSGDTSGDPEPGDHARLAKHDLAAAGRRVGQVRRLP